MKKKKLIYSELSLDENKALYHWKFLRDEETYRQIYQEDNFIKEVTLWI